jgi:hypothetical protein
MSTWWPCKVERCRRRNIYKKDVITSRGNSLYHYLRLYNPCGPWSLFQFFNLYIVSWTPWAGDKPVARPLHTHRTTQTQNTDIHALSGIHAHDPSVWAGEDVSFLRPRATVIGALTVHKLQDDCTFMAAPWNQNVKQCNMTLIYNIMNNIVLSIFLQPVVTKRRAQELVNWRWYLIFDSEKMCTKR